MKKKIRAKNVQLIKGGIQYLRGRILKNRKDKVRGLSNYLQGKYL